MSAITVSHLTFSYEGSYDYIFEDVSFSIDTRWKLGLIGRNGKGKTTFLKLLLNKFDYKGNITAQVDFEYFPFEIEDKSKNSCEIAENIFPNYEFWKLCKEISLLKMSEEVLFRPFETLSSGEQVKVLLAILFLKENSFLLIDEPTNHLDISSRNVIAEYLNSKEGFILVSHDRTLLDSCVNHILSINRNNIEVVNGNYTSWRDNKEKRDAFEIAKNSKLNKEISRLNESAKRSAAWSDKIESQKFGGKKDSGLKADRGFIGHKSAKMMQRAKNSESNKKRLIDEKSTLLKNIDSVPELKINPTKHYQNNIITATNLSILYDGKTIFDNLNFSIENGDRVCIRGKNGCGKSSILKLIIGEDINFLGNLSKANNLKISYVPQDTSWLKGNLKDFSKDNGIDESLFKSILRKLDFAKVQFEKNIENFSEGQKKKVLIAKSLCEEAHLYVWDEPLNFIDILSREQIEKLILEYQPTLLFVEHDDMFVGKIATKIVSV